MAKKAELSKSIAQIDKGPLKRILGVRDLFAVGFGDLGSSIYYALGITALYALGATPIALGIAGIVFICTALTYAEMSSTFPESGGSASFARHAFNDLISFIAGWGLLLDYIVTIAISAFAVAPYLAIFSTDLKHTEVQIGFTVLIIGVLFLVNVIGVKQSTRMSSILTSFTLATQILIIAIGGIWLLNLPYLIEHLRINVPNMNWSPTWPQFWKGTAMAMVAYTGIESIAQLGAEAKDPTKSLPKAVIRVMFVLVFMYLGISLVALSAISPHELGTTYVQDPIAGIVAHLPVGVEFLGPWLGILAAALLFSASNSGLIGASRLAFNLGEYYQLPRFFYRVHEKFRTPIIALAVFAALASILVVWSRGKLDFLADLYNFGAMVAFFSAHLSLIVMRVKKPDLARPFKIPFNLPFGRYRIPVTAIIGCFATFAVWILVVVTKPEGRYLGLGWMGAGLIMYFIYRFRKRIEAMGQLEIERVKIPSYKQLEIKNILVATKSAEETETIQMSCELAKWHGAKLTVVHVIEVPYSVPIDTPLPYRVVIGEALLKRAEAIARDLNVEIALEIIHSRSCSETILQMVDEGKYDLLVLGSLKHETDKFKGIGMIADTILRNATCRVWVFGSELKPG